VDKSIVILFFAFLLILIGLGGALHHFLYEIPSYNTYCIDNNYEGIMSHYNLDNGNLLIECYKQDNKNIIYKEFIIGD